MLAVALQFQLRQPWKRARVCARNDPANVPKRPWRDGLVVAATLTVSRAADWCEPQRRLSMCELINFVWAAVRRSCGQKCARAEIIFVFNRLKWCEDGRD